MAYFTQFPEAHLQENLFKQLILKVLHSDFMMMKPIETYW